MKKDFLVAFFAFLTILFYPLILMGTVGFAERHSQLHYNRFATVHWIHPGDGCDCGSYCFILEKINQGSSGFRGIDCSLQKINVPEDKNLSMVFTQCCSSRQWLVYDLQTEEILIETDDYEAALAIWKANGLEEPRFADAQNGAKGLHQTASSLLEELTWMALLFLPFLIVIAILGFSIFLLLSCKAYLRTRKRKYMILSVILFIPNLFLWGLGIQFIFRLLYYMFFRRIF